MVAVPAVAVICELADALRNGRYVLFWAELIVVAIAVGAIILDCKG